MGLSKQQIQVHVDFDLREVTILSRSPLDIKPTVIKAPFAVIKGLLATILKAEAEDELTVLTGLAEEASKTQSEEKKG